MFLNGDAHIIAFVVNAENFSMFMYGVYTEPENVVPDVKPCMEQGISNEICGSIGYICRGNLHGRRINGLMLMDQRGSILEQIRRTKTMKFSVSYSRKVKAGLSYEMLEIFASVESDTSVETMNVAFQRIRTFVETKIEEERNRLLDKSVKRSPT